MKGKASDRVITIHTDGSGTRRGNAAGWACLIDWAGGITATREHSGGLADGTNNSAELTAALKGVRLVDKLTPPGRRQDMVIVSDSMYVVQGINQHMEKWARRDFRRKGEDIANGSLWRSMWHLAGKHNIAARWVRGHARNAENERCDALANAARKML